jgi:hypothetical protein
MGLCLLSIVVATGTAWAVADADQDGDGLADAFEATWGVTSPSDDDSDGDGLIDPGEDPDGDGLSNLGEQRYGTHPGKADSDSDGIPDGDEDTDGDGRSDAQQQDQRGLPRDLRPSIEGAWWDRPDTYDDGCHNDAVDAGLHPCRFAALESDTRVVLFGDSHALQWLPAVVGAGLREGWEVVALTKAACPPAQVEFGRKEVGAAASCQAWRRLALASLAEDPPDLLLLSGAGRIYKLIDAGGARLSDEAALAEWRRGLALTLDALPSETRVVVLADTPFLRRNPPSCLTADPSDISACTTPRSAALDPALDEAERDTAEAAGAAFESLSELVCPYGPCPAVIGDILVWRNADHITATFAGQLAPSMGDLLKRYIGEP